MIKAFFLLAFFLFSGVSQAAGNNYPLDHAAIDSSDKPSLQRGAKYYVNYCLGCHALSYLRYNRMGRDLGLTESQVEENLIFTYDAEGSPVKPGEHMTNTMDAGYAEKVFGVVPPDLTLVARSRGVDWLYTYLRSFYADKTKVWGVNNAVFPNVGMPHVLSEMQGLQKAITEEYIDEQGNRHEKIVGFELLGSGSLSVEEYDQVVLDLTNFLAYAAEPAKIARHKTGVWVIAFLLLLLCVTYLLKKEYWRDIK
ncbi:MAG: cytochrome c1 [Gammaproteobacteria bacterium]|nr:cytochrome c1 [Gammaproteobacteria bacterium]